LKPERRAFLYVIGGEVTLNEERLSAGDQARVTGVTKLEISGAGDSEIILVDLP
jgi:redox-sensitive bicupin YhaK (pirin superfamily)